MLRKLVALVAATAVAAAAANAQVISREEYQKQLDERRLDLDSMSRESDPMAWAKAHVDFGIDLYLFDSLDEAILAYRSALEVYSRDGTPNEWAEGQKLLGAAYQRRAAMKGLAGFFIARSGASAPDTTADVAEALLAFEAAEEVYTLADAPVEWIRLQLLQAISHGMLARRDDDEGTAGQGHYEAAVAKYADLLQHADPQTEVLQRAFAHDGLASLNEHGYVNDSARIRFALEHARAAKADFITAGKPDEVERLDRMIDGLEYDLESAETYEPNGFDDVFGVRRN